MKTVLAVDDSPNIITLIKAKLTSNGFRVLTANNGVNAIKAVNESIPDLIILDIMMPEMDGFEVFSGLLEEDTTKGIPVVFLTASGKREDEERAQKMGACHFLTKPFSPKKLLEIVNEALR